MTEPTEKPVAQTESAKADSVQRACSAAVALNNEIAEALIKLRTCTIALRHRGDPMADDIWAALCVLSYGVIAPAKPPPNSDYTPTD